MTYCGLNVNLKIETQDFDKKKGTTMRSIIILLKKVSGFGNNPSHLVLALAQFLLQSTYQFILFPFAVLQVVVGQIAVFLLQFTFYFVPCSFYLQVIHQ